MANDYYDPVSLPVEFSRARAARIGGEMLNIETAFGKLPTLNRLMGNAQIFATEAVNSAANAIVLDSVYRFSDLEVGQSVRWLAENSNTAAVTVDIDDLGAKKILAVDQSELAAGAIRASNLHEIVYNGIDWILLHSPDPVANRLLFASRVKNLDITLDAAMDDVTLPTASGGTSPYTYSIVETLPTGLTFTAATRVLSGTPTVLGTTTLTYRATDARSSPRVLNTKFVVRVLRSVLTLNQPPDQQMTVGSQHSVVLPEATGGATPYTYTMNGIPPGLSFDPGRRILSGVPQRAGLYRTVSFSVTDGNGSTITRIFQVEIRANTALAIEGVEDRSYTKDIAITNLVLPVATGGLPEYTYTVTGLPTGLSFDAGTRTVSGTPTALTAGSTVTYTVTDQNGISESIEFEIAVVEGGRRYVFVFDSDDTVNAALLASGTNHPVDASALQMPTWSGGKLIGIAQPQGRDDLNYISLSALGNAISAFEKQTATVTIDSVVYEYWQSNEVQGGEALSGSYLNVRP